MIAQRSAVHSSVSTQSHITRGEICGGFVLKPTKVVNTVQFVHVSSINVRGFAQLLPVSWTLSLGDIHLKLANSLQLYLQDANTNLKQLESQIPKSTPEKNIPQKTTITTAPKNLPTEKIPNTLLQFNHNLQIQIVFKKKS